MKIFRAVKLSFKFKRIVKMMVDNPDFSVLTTRDDDRQTTKTRLFSNLQWLASRPNQTKWQQVFDNYTTSLRRTYGKF